MSHRPPTHFGPFSVIRPLGHARGAERWLAAGPDSAPAVIYILPPAPTSDEARARMAAIRRLTTLHHTHILPVLDCGLASGARPWLAAAFAGNHSGLLSLAELADSKGGRLAPSEVERAARHLLEASAHAHARGFRHGALDASDVLVDRHGCTLIELYAVHATTARPALDDDLAAEEARSIAALTYTLLTALPAPETARIPPSRLVPRLDPAWDAWIERALDPASGFATPAAALEALPSRADAPDASPPRPVVRPGVRAVLARLRARGAGV